MAPRALYTTSVPVMQPLPTEEAFVAWAAGFFDGESCVMIARLTSRHGGYHHQIRISVGQKVRAPLEALAARWGGTIRMALERRNNRATNWDWRLNGHAAIRFLTEIQPYLLVKHRQADIAARFARTLLTWGDSRSRPFLTPDAIALRERCYAEMRIANRRGRAA
jgi:hypothetical protein